MLIAIGLRHLRGSSEARAGLAVGLGAIHSLTYELLLQHVDVELHLAVEVAARPSARHPPRDTRADLSQRRHGAPSPESSRPMTSTIRAQSAASRTSCFRPSRVSE